LGSEVAAIFVLSDTRLKKQFGYYILE